MYGLRIIAENVRDPSDSSTARHERRLARAGFAGQEQDAFATPQAVQQFTERLLVRRAQVEELRVGRDREWLFGETVEGLVDGICQRP